MIFISGPIANNENFEIDFQTAQSKLCKKYGDCIINPVLLAQALPNYPNLKHEQYMAVSIAALSLCDTIHLLNDWESSKGAKQELRYALEHNYYILMEV